MQGTRVVKEMTDNGKYENTYLPEILEAAKKKCCAWFGVPSMPFGGSTKPAVESWAGHSVTTRICCPDIALPDDIMPSPSPQIGIQKVSSQTWTCGRQLMTPRKKKSKRSVSRQSRSLLQPPTTSRSMTHNTQQPWRAGMHRKAHACVDQSDLAEDALPPDASMMSSMRLLRSHQVSLAACAVLGLARIHHPRLMMAGWQRRS